MDETEERIINVLTQQLGRLRPLLFYRRKFINLNKTGYYIQCEECGKDIYQTKTQYHRAEHHFCSNKCQKQYQHKKVYEIRTCEVCGKGFEVRKKDSKRFCSTNCQHIWQTTICGEKHPKYARVKIACHHCGKEFETAKYRLDLTKSLFCSAKCRQAWYSQVYSQSEEWKEKSRLRAVQAMKNNVAKTNTKPQLLVNKFLEDLNIQYENEHAFKYYSVDNYLSQYNLIIEVMGDYWHFNPTRFVKEKMQSLHIKNIGRDRAKHTYLKKYHNIEVLYLWERDIYKNPELCKKLIVEYIQKNGLLENYNSFNYNLISEKLTLNKSIINTYQEMPFSA